MLRPLLRITSLSTMRHRYSDAKRIFVPYLAQTTEDGPVEPQVAALVFRVHEGTVDRRKVKRMIRRWVKENLERTLHTVELRWLMRSMHDVATY